MSIYYSDESVTLYHGDSLEILPTLDVKADVLLTDPPYFKVKQEEWDNQWDKASEFLGWMGDFLDRAKPLLTPQASVWVFASPAMTSSVERLVGERFRVLNSIRWVKPSGVHNKHDLTKLRSFLSPWEGILFGEQIGRDYENASEALRAKVFAPVGQYLTEEMARAGLTLEAAASEAGYSVRLGAYWRTGARFPTQAMYEKLQAVSGSGVLIRPYAELQAQYSHLTAEYAQRRTEHDGKRRLFELSNERSLATDIWNYKSVSAYPGKHPCEKPQHMLSDMLKICSREGDTVLDPFAGSGATLIAAANLGRRAIGIEKDERWCEHAAKRLNQGSLELEWTA